MRALLEELASLLYGRDYAVSLRYYEVPGEPDAPIESFVTRALGPEAVPTGCAPVTREQLLGEVERSLRYPGDSTHGPEPTALKSERLNALIFELMRELERSIARASALARFSLRSGHPDYPVYWDFAFFIAGPSEGAVFIGSASD
mgnify:CR=1 FL=1